MEGGHPEGSARDAAAPAGREPESSRPGRPRIVGNRPGHRAARPRPPAQARCQDRRRTPAHRGWHLRILRGDWRADLDSTPRSPPDRDLVDRGAGAPRAARARLPRRLIATRSDHPRITTPSDHETPAPPGPTYRQHRRLEPAMGYLLEFFDAEFAAATLAALTIPLVIAVSAALMTGKFRALGPPRRRRRTWLTRRRSARLPNPLAPPAVK